jgi:hypothetical protein
VIRLGIAKDYASHLVLFAVLQLLLCMDTVWHHEKEAGVISHAGLFFSYRGLLRY